MTKDHDKHAHAGIVPQTYQIEREGESGLKPWRPLVDQGGIKT